MTPDRINDPEYWKNRRFWTGYLEYPGPTVHPPYPLAVLLQWAVVVVPLAIFFALIAMFAAFLVSIG